MMQYASACLNAERINDDDKIMTEFRYAQFSDYISILGYQKYQQIISDMLE